MRKLVVFSLLLTFLGVGLYWAYLTYPLHEVQDFRVPGKLAPVYVKVAEQSGIPWTILVAMDEVTNQYEKATPQTIKKQADQLQQELAGKEPTTRHLTQVLSQIYSQEQVTQIIELADLYAWEAGALGEPYAFPFHTEDRDKVTYADGWGDGREYGGKRKHEGTDLMAPKGTPILSVGDGEVVRKGWNRLGGWRLQIQDREHPHIYYYYAHMSQYADQIEEGTVVKKGQIIGFVGDSGYGPEGTTGQFAPHLHLGIYVKGWPVIKEAINPFPFLKVWEENNK
ncbi:M23 family metallopeptidase [Hazenella coriacea]|uniref:Murein DD-endopeptidase MepM/ murein hydrolase activator NlpD n=1 Tax=Hazenella coriacea TaxID=1179467 RepID=A0A4R3L962_9BACL|nr:M23 family metallopeptidase [Hazenella coriacea]TCS96591.1 murein DD-endopeptidase MepM/ murein hydrolase activator NlpD [Hazenella coriacea]